MLIALIQLIGGFVLLVWAADRLVAGASATARNFGVSPMIIGLTIIGFGTSAPELVVSAVASFRGNPGLAVGNAIGSNIANLGLILGFTALVYPLKVESQTLRREYPLLLLIMVVCLVMVVDLEFTRIEGVLLLLGLVGLMGWMIYLSLARGGPADPLAAEFEAEIPRDMPTRTALLWLLVGLVALPLSSSFLVDGAITIARTLGVSDTLIGLTIVAFGTSLPELATAITSALRHEDDLAIGNVIGSNMFNLLGVLGIASVVAPIQVPAVLLSRDFPAMFVITGLVFMMATGLRGPARIGRVSGAVLLSMFVGYQVMVWTAVAG
ncbi:MAG: calcium/sodium antiporter [Xanthomonadales bacterium]|nr:calcium/sodium antiporter [Xanthomonadales bacterium]